jgi:DNA topoisomerase-1
MNLVIVESPTKAKTIEQFLGKDYAVESSFGHVRDLPEKKLGIDIEHNFEPEYVIIPKAKKRLEGLKEKADKSDKLILATDEDREGEAIAWHLIRALNLDELKIKNQKLKVERIVFHEITKDAIEEAFRKPRGIDINLVDAQQARRILDRLVGYKLSPLLWKKIARGLSAGRVQSVAVRLIVERQQEIDKFKPEEYWSIEAEFKDFKAKLIKEIKTKKEADEIIKDLKGAEYKVVDIRKKEIKRYPLPPFTTSALQQEASHRLGFSAKQTMVIAQQLYETGFITYHRTDSLNLAEEFIKKVQKFVTNKFGKEYISDLPRRYKTKAKRAQEAHEAIRPAYPEKEPESIKTSLNKNQYKLYKLIWGRAIASQMQPAALDSTSVDIGAGNYLFRATGATIKFDGFLKAYPIKISEIIMPPLQKNEILKLLNLAAIQHFTKPPAPFSEATLVKTLEEYGIGRPSTYAPILSTIQERNYVKKENRYLYPTEMGIIVNNLLVKHFPEIVNIEFTARMEEDLDKISQGKQQWIPVIKNFYQPFNENLQKKYEEIDKKELTEEKTDKICEKCGKPMIIKIGRFGKFLACSGFPQCKNTLPLQKEEQLTNKICAKCGAEMKIRTGRYGKFLGCSNYPKCDYIEKIKKHDH